VGQGLFSQWQPEYAERGIATFPVREKRPAVRGYLKIGLPASQQFAIKFPAENAFGLACARNRITVLDVDAPDERLMADALAEFGPTPFIVRSGSGNWQAWYRHNGERRRVRPDPARPIDILGDGFVVAPPSVTSKGAYHIVDGTLDDLDRLPTMRRPQPANCDAVEVASRPQERIQVGKRNQELWRACMGRSRQCKDVSELLRSAAEMNSAMFYEPLPDDEVLRIVASAWMKEVSGQNWFGSGGKVVLDATEVDELLQQDPDAFALLLILRRHHDGARTTFVVANAMHDRMPGSGWPLKRFAAARRRLEELGEIKAIRNASRLNGPALYQFKGGRK
jgi:hypothetical protein